MKSSESWEATETLEIVGLARHRVQFKHSTLNDRSSSGSEDYQCIEADASVLEAMCQGRVIVLL